VAKEGKFDLADKTQQNELNEILQKAQARK
jgi:hypothetical protein